VSVLLPAWNEGAGIERCLAALTAIEWPALEIIVCAGGADETLARAQRFASERVTVFEQQPGEGKQAALRRCFERSRGAVLYLTDADCVVPEATFEAVIAPVARGEAAAATGGSRPFAEQRSDPFVFHQWSVIRAVERNRPPESTGLLGRNCAISRNAVEAAGAFAQPTPIGTDYHLAKRLLANGESIRFVPAEVETAYPTRPKAYVRQQSRWLRNIVMHGTRYGDREEVAAVGRTVTTGLGLLTWPLTWRWTRRPGLALWLVGLGYLVAARLAYGRALAEETGTPLRAGYLVRLPAFALLDLVAWTWPLVDALIPARRFRW
jgi:cellulose synthase/poly-beta-1,6-N-acetylglucosamine synthase-like glycosyltransferase